MDQWKKYKEVVVVKLYWHSVTQKDDFLLYKVTAIRNQIEIIQRWRKSCVKIVWSFIKPITVRRHINTISLLVMKHRNWLLQSANVLGFKILPLTCLQISILKPVKYQTHWKKKKNRIIKEDIPIRHPVWFCPTRIGSLLRRGVAEGKRRKNPICYPQRHHTHHDPQHGFWAFPYALGRLIRWRCFSFKERIRNGFKRKDVIFEDSEEGAVPSVSWIWRFKPLN